MTAFPRAHFFEYFLSFLFVAENSGDARST